MKFSRPIKNQLCVFAKILVKKAVDYINCFFCLRMLFHTVSYGKKRPNKYHLVKGVIFTLNFHIQIPIIVEECLIKSYLLLLLHT